MEAEDLIFDYSCYRQVVEEISEVFPYIGIAVFSLAFIVEAIDLCDLSAFMISSQDSYSISEPHFEKHQ